MNAKKLLMALALMAAPILMISCNDDDDATPDDPNDTFGATLNGGQEVPPTSSTATGTYAANYNRVTRVLSYTVAYQGFTPTMGHIHSVTATTAEGNNGPVSIGFTSLTSPIVGQTTLTQAQQDEMYARRTYANLHSAQFPNGEIRGNIRQTD